MRKFLILCGLLAGGAGGALAQDLNCPASLEVQESPVAPLPEGWTPSTQAGSRYLAGVSFFDGEPGLQRSLAPQQDRPVGRDRVATWEFSTDAEPIWMACRYQDSRVLLSRPLPQTVSRCQVRYGAGGVLKSVQCTSASKRRP